jgi:uncharacterized membrane protein YfcA
VHVFLPIAGMSVSVPVLVALGALVGFISGMFGIGGGFLMTPVLVLLGIPPQVAVASISQHVVASSASSIMAISRRGGVDLRMGAVLSAGGVVGALTGVEVFRLLRFLGQADLVVSLSYLVLLSLIGGLMLNESLLAVIRARKGTPPPPRPNRRPAWLYSLPLRMKFPASRLYISVLPPLILGLLVGMLSAIMGVGGGFILVPAMVYLLRMPARTVVGTSLLQIVIVAAMTCMLQAGRNQNVDIVLGVLLLAGGVVGAQLGARASARFRAEELRVLLSIIILVVGLRMGLDLIVRPAEPFVLLAG